MDVVLVAAAATADGTATTTATVEVGLEIVVQWDMKKRIMSQMCQIDRIAMV